MNRQTRKRDRQAKTIGVDPSTRKSIKGVIPWIIAGAILWAGLLKGIIWIINYRVGG